MVISDEEDIENESVNEKKLHRTVSFIESIEFCLFVKVEKNNLKFKD